MVPISLYLAGRRNPTAGLLEKQKQDAAPLRKRRSSEELMG
jgi:hypothetical protein